MSNEFAIDFFFDKHSSTLELLDKNIDSYTRNLDLLEVRDKLV